MLKDILSSTFIYQSFVPQTVLHNFLVNDTNKNEAKMHLMVPVNLTILTGVEIGFVRTEKNQYDAHIDTFALPVKNFKVVFDGTVVVNMPDKYQRDIPEQSHFHVDFRGPKVDGAQPLAHDDTCALYGGGIKEMSVFLDMYMPTEKSSFLVVLMVQGFITC